MSGPVPKARGAWANDIPSISLRRTTAAAHMRIRLRASRPLLKQMTADSDVIADLVLRRFRELPAKRKPQIRDNGLHEWVPLSAIVAEEDGVLTCISLA